MKKNKLFDELHYRSLKRNLQFMCISIFLLISGIQQAHATDAFPQKTRLSLDFSNTELIKVFDKEISLLQQKQISGTVSDINGPVIGANVVVTGTTIGTITDVNGKYNLSIPQDAQSLTFSLIGMESQVINIGTQTQIDVKMTESVIGLNEVVVVGYSVQKKMDITGSVTVVNVEELKKVPGSNLAQQLQGKAAGVFIGSTGGPGSNTMVRIRGIGTVNNNGPLYVIDGVSTRNQNLNSINPNDIESVQVLKDASAASIYGAQASNGVIIITTKKGALGPPKVKYDAYFSVATPPPSYDLLNTTDRIDLEWKAKTNAYSIRGVSTLPSHAQFGTGITPVYPNYIVPTASAGPFTVDQWTETNRITEFNRNGQGDQWYKASVRNAPVQSHQITISGANESAKYLLGVNYYNEEGILKYNYYKRYSARLNTEYKIRKWLTVGENLLVTFSNSNVAATEGEANVFAQSLRMDPWVPVYDIKGIFAGSRAQGAGNGRSPIADLTRAKDNYRNNLRTFGNIYTEAAILPNLKFRSTFGLDNGRAYHYAMDKKEPERAEGRTYNQFNEDSNFNLGIQWTNTMTFAKTFNDLHSFNFLVGSEFINNGFGRSMSGSRRNYLFEDDVNTWLLSNGERENMDNSSSWNGKVAMFGIFSRMDYVYDNRYLLTATIRRDGSSRFSEANRYGIFPALSGGWRISNEKFMENMTWLSDLKLRAGYGITGNSEIPRANNWATEYGTDPGHTNYDFTASQGTAEQGFMLITYGNSNTKWESTQMLNLGVDFTLYRGVLDGSVEYYIKNTSDMLVLDSYSALAGEATPPFVNLGKMENVGWDFTLNHRNNIGEIGYNVGIVFSTYKNEVVKLNQAPGTRFWGGKDSRLGQLTMTELGSPISVFYGYNIIGFYESEEDVLNYKGISGKREGLTVLPLGVGTDAALKTAQWIGKWKYEDVDGNGLINAADQKILGNPHPDFTGSVNFGLKYQNFDLNTSLYFSVGNEILNYAKWWTDFWSYEGNRSSTMRDRSWEPGKTDALLPILDYMDPVSNKNPNSYYVEDGSFLRMQMLSLGYTFPKSLTSRIGFENLHFYLQATNLFTLTNYSGLDPDVTNQDMGDSGDLTKGVDFFHWPVSRQFLFGINVAF